MKDIHEHRKHSPTSYWHLQPQCWHQSKWPNQYPDSLNLNQEESYQLTGPWALWISYGGLFSLLPPTVTLDTSSALFPSKPSDCRSSSRLSPPPLCANEKVRSDVSDVRLGLNVYDPLTVMFPESPKVALSYYECRRL